MPKKYLSTQEAAAFAGRKDSSTIRKAIINGWLKATQLGERSYMVEQKDLEHWIADGRRTSPKPPEN